MLEQCFLLQHSITETVVLQIRETYMTGLALPAPVDCRKCWILFGNKQRMVQRGSVLNAFSVGKKTSSSCCIIIVLQFSSDWIRVCSSQLEDKQCVFLQSILLNGTYLIPKCVFYICLRLLSPQEAVMCLPKRSFALPFFSDSLFSVEIGSRPVLSVREV